VSKFHYEVGVVYNEYGEGNIKRSSVIMKGVSKVHWEGKVVLNE